MKKPLMMSLAVHFLISTKLFASGFGICYTYDAWGEVNEDSYFVNRRDVSREVYDHLNYGLGFTYDSNLTKDELVNFRWEILVVESKSFEFDYLEIDQESFKYLGVDIHGSGYKLIFNLGFGLVRNNFIRLWTGLELAGGHYKTKGEAYWQHTPVGSPHESHARGSLHLYGLGAVLGINFNCRGKLTIPVKVSYSYNEGQCTSLPSTTDNGFSGEISEKTLVFTLGIMFRTGENGVPYPNK